MERGIAGHAYNNERRGQASLACTQSLPGDSRRDGDDSWRKRRPVCLVCLSGSGFRAEKCRWREFESIYAATEVEHTEVENGIHVCTQRYSGGDGCVTAWKDVQVSPNRRIYWLSIASGHNESAIAEAVEAVRQASGANFEEWVQAHRDWWHQYYRQSFVSLPDGRLETFTGFKCTSWHPQQERTSR